MTSLPINLPKGLTLLVKKGDIVKKGQVLAQSSTPESTSSSSPSTPQAKEVVLSLSDHFGESSAKVGKYLLKSPGERIASGEVIAVKKGGFTLTSIRLVSQVKGTVMRFERGTGSLVVRLDRGEEVVSEPQQTSPTEIVSPLDGKVALCNNETIVLESEGDALVGSKGSGSEVIGELDISLFERGSKDTPVLGSKITKDLIDKIIVVWAIEKEAVVKCDAIGVKGVITTSISDDEIAYFSVKHFSLPVVEVDEAVAKQLQKNSTSQIVLNGREKSIIEAH